MHIVKIVVGKRTRRGRRCCKCGGEAVDELVGNG